MKITLIGLGTDEFGLTRGAENALKNAGKILARTANTRSFAALKEYEVEPLDVLFEKSRNFDSLNTKLAKAVLDAAKQCDVCYCVDGAVCEDEACRIILAKHGDCEVFGGEPKSAHAANLAKLKNAQYTTVSAYDVQNLKSCRAAVVYDVDCYYISTAVKKVLSDIFGEESDCSFIRGDECERIKIYEIDRRRDYDYSCAVAVEESEFLKKQRYDFADLEHMIKLLRAPDGCPWDRVQTNESIKTNLIEEAYELADAIERGDDYDMEEETGDVLLQAAFHAVMKDEQGAFNGTDAITRLVKKLIFRHSHIFGKDKAKDDAEALGVWEKNKREEKSQKTYSDTVVAVPKNMPACMRAQKVGKRAAKCGMDFLSPLSASEKLTEEVAELIEACVAEDKEAIFDEAGDVLFSAVNVCRLAGVDCEDALHAAVDKFTKRFAAFEKIATEKGEKVDVLDDSRMEYYWTLAKNELKKH